MDKEFIKRKNKNFQRFFDSYYEQPFEKKKERVGLIEQEIRGVVGDDPDDLRSFVLQKHKDDLLLLLDERRFLLNWMFMETPEEVERMKIVNSRLYELTNRLRVKMADVCEGLMAKTRDDFDDDYEVEGTLKFWYNDPDSILPYKGDEMYGSDYSLMIAVNNYLTGDDPLHFLELNCRFDDSRELILQSGNCDDDYSWAHDTPGIFEGIYICYTTAFFCKYCGYPLFDVLHLNDFWNEVHVRYQHFATQDAMYKYARD